MKLALTWKTCLRTLGLWGGFTASALALNLAEVTSPTQITDGQISIGTRTLTLPASGDWYVLYTRKGNITTNNLPVGDTLGAYMVNLKDGAFVASFYISVPIDSVTIARWSSTPCDTKAPTVFKDDFNSGFKTPKCLSVFPDNQHLTETGNYNKTATQWLKSKGIALPGPLWSVSYSNYASNEFGNFSAYLPNAAHPKQEPAIAYGKTVARDLADFFEKRTKQAALPAFP